MISKMDGFKTLFTSTQSLLRPMLLLALGLHALFLFVPLPSGQAPPSPTSDSTKSTDTPPVPTPGPTPKAKILNSKKSLPAIPLKPTKTPLVAAKPLLSLSSKKNRSLLSNSASVASPGNLTMVTGSALAPTTVENQSSLNGSDQSVISLKREPQDTARSLYELLADLPIPDPMDPAFTHVAKPEDLSSPDLFFQPIAEPDLVPEPLPGLDGSPLITLGEEPKYFFQTYFEQPLATIFDTITPIGEYGGEPLYKLSKGSYTVYLSLIAPKGRVGTIVSIWTRDPRTASR